MENSYIINSLISSPVSTSGKSQFLATRFPSVPKPFLVPKLVGFPWKFFAKMVPGTSSLVWSVPFHVGSLPWSEVIINKSSLFKALINFVSLMSKRLMFSA